MSEIRLSERQQWVVSFGDGALLVVAGPGSGKTRVLTERVRRLATTVKGHFRILALTFTNKAANEMRERLRDVPDLKTKASIGTIHGFCLEMLSDRGKPVGVSADAQIFESYGDRKQILLDAVSADPLLSEALLELPDEKARSRRVDEWLKAIGVAKAHPVSRDDDDPSFERLYQAYNAGLRACGAYDFDDLLLLAYTLLTENPQIADFYRRLYRYVCIDEAQDLNEAQYQVIRALCGDEYRNVMMVGDPRQSIYGFNTSSPEYMDQFVADFQATKVDLIENFRSSKAVVDAARALLPKYTIEGQLPVVGEVALLVGVDEKDEAELVVQRLKDILRAGHSDIEGQLTPSRCAILGRTRFALLEVEKQLVANGMPFIKRLSATHENSSTLVKDYFLALRVAANPRDALHLAALAKRWKVPLSPVAELRDRKSVVEKLRAMSMASRESAAAAVVAALKPLFSSEEKLGFSKSLDVLRNAADDFAEDERRSVYEDTAVILQEWDQYLRMGGKRDSLAGFLSSVALGTTQQSTKEGVSLLTVHSSKGLEYDVVFVVGMADGTFPDYRARNNAKATSEELRNAFVAVTRSKRILFLSYPKSKMMPWGDIRSQDPSPYLRKVFAKR